MLLAVVRELLEPMTHVICSSERTSGANDSCDRQ